MKIEELDNNLLVESDITEPDIVWLDVKNGPFIINGVFYDEKDGRYLRMPQDIADKVSEGVSYLNRHTAGGRVRFRTNSGFIGIRAIMNRDGLMPHMPSTGQSGFDLYRKKEGEDAVVFCYTYIPSTEMKTGFDSSYSTNGQMAEYTINFPLYDGVNELYIALKKDAVIEAPAPYKYEEPVVYYGSSITQGGCASRPGNCYQAIISRRLNVDHVNLGFSGGAKGEDAMINYLAGLEMKVFVCDYDHNAPSLDHLKATHMPLYRAIRKAQPKLPIIFVSSPGVLINPVLAERREVIRDTYETALREGDRQVYYIDGGELFAGEDWDSCTVDGCHPNDLGFYRMAMRIGKELRKILRIKIS